MKHLFNTASQPLSYWELNLSELWMPWGHWHASQNHILATPYEVFPTNQNNSCAKRKSRRKTASNRWLSKNFCWKKIKTGPQSRSEKLESLQTLQNKFATTVLHPTSANVCWLFRLNRNNHTFILTGDKEQCQVILIGVKVVLCSAFAAFWLWSIKCYCISN